MSKTVKLKIAVVVDAKGAWSAIGWSGKDAFAERFSMARDNLPYAMDDDPNIPTIDYIIEATVEVPARKPVVVQGTAKP